MKSEAISFPCGQLTLEGLWHTPDGPGPLPAVVVCHPHPLYGGDMNNDIVGAICSSLVKRGIAALRFNFRGVGRSEGKHGRGVAERQDVVAALDYVSSRPGVAGESPRLGLAGYSFGAGVALQAALGDTRVKALALVSPVFGKAEMGRAGSFARPKLLIWGRRDEFAREAISEAPVLAGPEPAHGPYVIIEGADHFWWGREAEVGELVGGFFERELKG